MSAFDSSRMGRKCNGACKVLRMAREDDRYLCLFYTHLAAAGV